MIVKKQFLIVWLFICVFAVIVLTLWGSAKHTKTKEMRNQETQEQVLSYIAQLSGKKFDFVLATQQLDLTNNQLRDHLLALEERGKIQCIPRYSARKPILISLDDMTWYYDQVYVVEE